ncbi:MAG: hypothetical protein PUG84_07335 [Peptoniphilaceae bacterium]|nr:hypothetical protein [Peptoniphilaceae bacterium]
MKKIFVFLFTLVLCVLSLNFFNSCHALSENFNYFDNVIFEPLDSNVIEWTPEIGRNDEQFVDSMIQNKISFIPLEYRIKYFDALENYSKKMITIPSKKSKIPEVHIHTDIPLEISKFHKSEATSDYIFALNCLKTDNEVLKQTVNAAFPSIPKELKEQYFNSLSQTSSISAIRGIFKVNRLPISYHFYNHSLTSSPSDLRFNIVGYPAQLVNRYDGYGIESNIKQGMYVSQFNLDVANFGYSGNDELNQDGFHFEFALNSDLGLAIHGTTNLRYHRMYYGKTFFRLYDVYDFNTMYNYLIQFLDPINNTHTFNVYIDGLVIERNLE